MKSPIDYADKSSLLNGSLDDLEDHWHRESTETRVGKIALSIIMFLIMFVTGVTYAVQPAAPKQAQKMTVSVMSLVDDKGGE
jgi:hypothetical protein